MGYPPLTQNFSAKKNYVVGKIFAVEKPSIGFNCFVAVVFCIQVYSI